MQARVKLSRQSEKDISFCAIDPGNEKSAYVILNEGLIVEKAILPNDEMLCVVEWATRTMPVVIEMVACYGMPVGKEIFDTAFWVGRFAEISGGFELVYRKDIKLHLCGSMRAKDGNIRQALLDRWGKEATKGVHKDMWAALAVATYWMDTHD